MPFYEEENNNPFIPTTEQSNYGYKIEELKLQKEKPAPTFSEAFSAGFNTENWIARESKVYDKHTSVEKGLNDRFMSDASRNDIANEMEGFDYTPFIREQDKDYEEWYSKVANENDVKIIQNRIDENLKRREFVNNGGLGSALGMVAGAMLSPELLIPVIGEASLLSKGKLAVNLVRTFGTNIASDGIHELINFNTDKTYTNEQLGYAMLGSVMLNGIFSGFAYKGIKNQALKAENEKQVIDSFTDDVINLGSDLDPLNSSRSVGAAETVESAWEIKADDLLRKLHGSNLGTKKSYFIPNNLMGALSKSKTVRKITGSIYENNFYYKDNALGKAMPASLELKLERHKGKIVTSFTKQEKIYKEYIANTSNRMSKAEFRKEISKAIRAGTHENAFVAKAARMYKKEVFEPLAQSAKKLGLLDKDLVNPKYLNRVWNREAVIANRPVLKEKLVTYFKTLPDNANVESVYLEEAADKTIKNILGGDVMKSNVYSIGSNASPLKKKVLDIEDEVVEDFLENDIEKLTKRYVDNMSKAVEKEKFLKANGWDSISDIEVEVRDEFNKLMEGITDPVKLKELEQSKIEAIDFVKSAFNRVMGYTDNNATFDSALTNIMKLSTLSKLGSVLLSSIGDIGRLTQEFGQVALGRGLKLMLNRATKGIKKEEYARIGALTEKVLNNRYNAMVGVEDYTGHGIISNTIDSLYKKFGKITLMEQWNDGVKTMAIYAGEHSILKNSLNLVSKKDISDKAIEEMARWGVDKDVAKRIGVQFKKYGNKDKGIFSSNFEKWDDGIAIDAFTNALTKISLQVINTPTKGALPKVFDSVLGKAIMQFKSFMYASHVQTLIPMLQSPDAKRLIGTAEMIGIGSLMYYAKEYAYNDNPKVGDWKKIISEGVDRSGVLALPFEINNVMEKVSGDNVGIRPLLGLGQSQRMRNVNRVGSLAGPLTGMATDASFLIAHSLDGDLTKGDISRGVRLMPYQNLFWTRWATDRLKGKLQDYVE